MTVNVILRHSNTHSDFHNGARALYHSGGGGEDGEGAPSLLSAPTDSFAVSQVFCGPDSHPTVTVSNYGPSFEGVVSQISIVIGSEFMKSPWTRSQIHPRKCGATRVRIGDLSVEASTISRAASALPQGVCFYFDWTLRATEPSFPRVQVACPVLPSWRSFEWAK